MLHENDAVMAEDEVWRSKWPVLSKDRWETLRTRMVDELSSGLSLARFATEARFSVEYLQS